MTGLRLLADENIAAPLVHVLRRANIDVIYVAEIASGITDDEVLEKARREGRLLLTEDKDFGELVFRMKRDLPGVIMLRLPIAPVEIYRSYVLSVLERYADKFSGCYTVIEQKRVRFRPLPTAGNGEL
ncbi:DUF5615 family PIN-like protein [Methylohalobius crimeensis]|uniref:DUF5615 family PIN-like protein n=1 Tax=Methylohalobius crimeensis TaxID=244365 RepID=UPI0003B48435